MDLFKDIVAFHEKFGLDYNGPPREMPEGLDEFRTKFMAEELAEYITSDKDNQRFIVDQLVLVAATNVIEVPDLEKKLDALVDLVYVALGTAYMHGFNFNEAWRRVHAANMAKVRAQRASDSQRGSTFDVVKPENWQAPDLSDLVRAGHVD